MSDWGNRNVRDVSKRKRDITGEISTKHILGYGAWYDGSSLGRASILALYVGTLCGCLLFAYTICSIMNICRARWRRGK